MARLRESSKDTLSMSEVMTIMVWFHISGYHTFKWYYKNYVCNQLRGEFLQLVSYNRFVELMSAVVIPLCVYLHTRRGGKLHTRHRSVFNFMVRAVFDCIYGCHSERSEESGTKCETLR